MKTRGYDYKNIKTFQRGMILGLTKKLSSFRFIDFRNPNGEQDKSLNFAKSIGLIHADYLYEHNADLFLFKAPRKITSQQTKFGKVWLKNHFFKKDGTPRNSKATENVGTRVLSISKKVSKFEFVGVIGCKNSMGDYVQFLPVYRTYNRKGQYFDYAPIFWGMPIIMEGN